MYFNYRGLSENEEAAMMTFHLRPDSNLFNRIIVEDVKLYDVVDDDITEEKYITLEGEQWWHRRYRVERAEQKKIEKKSTNVRFCHPLRLSWAYAAVK